MLYEGRAELVDAVRLGRHVDPVGAVDLHVDVPRDDPPSACVDIDHTVTAVDERDEPTVGRHRAVVQHTVGCEHAPAADDHQDNASS